MPPQATTTNGQPDRQTDWATAGPVTRAHASAPLVSQQLAAAYPATVAKLQQAGVALVPRTGAETRGTQRGARAGATAAVPATEAAEATIAAQALAQAPASVVQLPGGRAAMVFALVHPTLGPLRCTVTGGHGGVVATFASSDVNTRRLLQAEAPRLRNQLEARGLSPCVVEVVAEVADHAL